jgi:hypothetical protein
VVSEVRGDILGVLALVRRMPWAEEDVPQSADQPEPSLFHPDDGEVRLDQSTSTTRNGQSREEKITAENVWRRPAHPLMDSPKIETK